MDTEPEFAPPLVLTPKAIEMAKQKLAEVEEPIMGLRLGVKGGGCSGLAYVIDYATKIRQGRDEVFDYDGLQVVIDSRSAEHLRGTTLDWEQKLLGYGFKWVNPSAKGTCGCGESFTY